MANTLKFGNGQWATKVGSTLAYNDEGGNFKPLPFNFTRSTIATRVNKEGLIEVVTNNKPRIDFLNDSNGALLLEPQKTNLIPYSTLDFNGGVNPNGWSIGFGTGSYSYEQLEYKGQKAVKQTQITTGRSYLDTGTLTLLTNTQYTLKIQFILDECVADDNDYIVIFQGFGSTGDYQFSDIDSNGVLEIQFNPLLDNIGTLRIGLGVGGNEDGGKSLAWAIPQLEQGSYATSYIPTQGSAVTRVAETASQTTPDGIIGQTEGTMFFEGVIYGENPSVNRRIFTISNGTSATAINIQTPAQNSKLEFEVTNGGAAQVFISSDNNSLVYGQNFKAAFAYKSNDFVAYINGVQIGTDTNGTVPTCDKLSFDRGNNTSNFEGSVNQAKLYNTRLSNAELQALTS